MTKLINLPDKVSKTGWTLKRVYFPRDKLYIYFNENIDLSLKGTYKIYETGLDDYQKYYQLSDRKETLQFYEKILVDQIKLDVHELKKNPCGCNSTCN